MFFILLPFHVDVPMRRLPWMNWVLMALTVLCFPFGLVESASAVRDHPMILGSGNWFALVGHMFAHGGIIHLIGNMLFLWVFGNAVCAKVGNLAYPVVYLGLGVAAGLAHMLLDGRPMVGASGAINGIVGVYVIWYLLNDISCWYLYWVFGAGGTGTFQVSSYWMVLLWFAFDLVGALLGGGGVAYLAHLAGLGAGAGLSVLLLTVGLVEMDEGERSLLQVLSGDEDDRGGRSVRQARQRR
jgi:membrane associated rhomboid family serine protease